MQALHFIFFLSSSILNPTSFSIYITPYLSSSSTTLLFYHFLCFIFCIFLLSRLIHVCVFTMRRLCSCIMSNMRWVVSSMEDFGTGFCVTLIKKILFASFACTFALGGAVVGIVIGAMKGQTTETGLVRGSGIGAVTGAITAVQLLDSFTNGEPLSKVALLHSMVDGKVFMEWVSPAVLKAYQFQVTAMESAYNESADIYESDGVRGLSQDCIQNLPRFAFQCHGEVAEPCSICLQELKDGELMRKMTSCAHSFHLLCIDKWLTRNSTCPICRTFICNHHHDLQTYN